MFLSKPVVGPAASWAALWPSTRPRGQTTGGYRFLTIGLREKVPVVFAPETGESARGFREKVPVDNYLFTQAYAQPALPGMGSAAGSF
jgi:hypothetical protein